MHTGRTLRTRLVVAFVALVAGALLLTGAIAYTTVRATARDAALDDLEEKSQVAFEQTAALRRLMTDPATDDTQPNRPFATFVRGVSSVLRFAQARIVFVGDDRIVRSGRDLSLAGLRNDDDVATTYALPAGVRANELDTAGLLAGETVRGSSGSTVFVARPLEFPQRPRFAQQHPVLVLADEIDTNVIGRAAPYLVGAAAAALLVSIGVAIWLGRRMTRPLREMESTATRLAAGDLAARATVQPRTDRELAAVATSLNQLARELERARGAERAFLLSISHDLRTPLTSIRGYAEALLDGTLDDRDPEARARAASIITAEARRLERLVRDLLDLARLDSEQFSLRPRRCDAAAVVADAAEAFTPAAHDLGVALAVHRDGAIDADLDPDRLAQVVANLVENALKYADQQVDVHVAANNGAVEVAVVDDGPGVPDDELPRVFEPLYTGRGSSGRAVGTGLGLAIVRQLARAMGGHAEAAPNGTDGGSRFVVLVPTGGKPPST